MDLKDPYRVVIYGDSISKGIVFDEKRAKYVFLKESFGDILRNYFKGAVYAVGKFGNTIIGGAEKLQNQVLEKQPNIVLLEFGGNDCDFDWEEIAKHPFDNHSPRTDLNVFIDTLKNMIRTLQNNKIVPILMSLPPLDAERYFSWISKQDPFYQENILKWLGTISKIYWWHERYNSAIIDVANETKTQLINVRGSFLKEEDFRKYICVDGIHPNADGHQLIAHEIIHYVQENYSELVKA